MTRVLVLQGGPSSEAAVSRVSAAGVADALATQGFAVTRAELGPDALRRLLDEPFDVVFPVLHGAIGEDGCVQGMCEVLGIAYVGSAVRASALAMHKPTAKRMFRDAGLPILPEVVVRRGGNLVAAAGEVLAAVGRDVAIKPSSGGSAIGVQLLRGASSAELERCMERALEVTAELLVERLVVGRELTCGVLGTDASAVALPPTEIHAIAGEFYDYQAKYAAGGSRHECPAKLDAAATARVQQIALGAHRALGCRDLSRSDVLLSNDGSLWLLETNTMPGFTQTSLLPEAAAVSGMAFGPLCERLVLWALARGAGHREAEVAFPGAP